MPKPNTRDAMKRYRAGKAGFTDKAHLKAKGLIPRADGTKKKSPQYESADTRELTNLYNKRTPLTPAEQKRKAELEKKLGVNEETPANATGTAVAGTGDDSSTVVVRRKKDKEKMKDRLLRRFKIKETIDRLVPAIEPPTDEVRERVDQLKTLALGEAFTSQQIRQAYGILNDPRYKQGNYSGAVSAIEKLAKGLSKHPDVANALRRANEGFASDAQRRAAFASGYKAKGKKKKKEETDLEEQKRELMLTYGKPGEKVKAYYTMFMQDLQNKASELRKKGFVVDKMGLKQPMSKLRDTIPEDMDRQPQDKDVKKVKGTQPKKYYKTLDKKTKKKRADFFKTRKPYRKSDDDDDYKPAPGDAKAKTKPSGFTKKFKQMYGEVKDINETITAVKNKAKKTGMPYSILKQVYNRGMAAWKGGHRPGATQQQWALARVNSFVTKSSGTWGGADKDLAKKVRAAKK